LNQKQIFGNAILRVSVVKKWNTDLPAGRQVTQILQIKTDLIAFADNSIDLLEYA